MPKKPALAGRPRRQDSAVSNDPMALVFRALADACRRNILDQLRDQPGQTLNGIVQNIGLRRQTVSQHLKILLEAELISVLREGRENKHYLNPVPLREVAGRWIDEITGNRADALSAMKQALEEKENG